MNPVRVDMWSNIKHEEMYVFTYVYVSIFYTYTYAMYTSTYIYIYRKQRERDDRQILNTLDKVRLNVFATARVFHS